MTKDDTSFRLGRADLIGKSSYIDAFIDDIRVGTLKIEGTECVYFNSNGESIEVGEVIKVYELTQKAEKIYREYYNKQTHDIVWFNTWFSTIRVTIDELKKAFPNTRFIGSNKEEICTYSNVVNEYFQEPVGLSPEEYVDFALETCAKYGVTIFFPKAYMKTIAQHIEDFKTLGVKVVCEDYNIIKTFDSKDKVYKILEALNYDKVPEYSIANNTADFIEQFKQYTSEEKEVCVKFDKDEGAASFRVVTDKFLKCESMQQKLENILTPENMTTILTDAELNDQFKPLMVMPKILSPEVSVDCYNSSQLGFIAIPRYKIGNRVKEIRLNQELMDDCKRLMDIFNFKSAFNVQYRWTPEGKPKLLEINTRLSGGIHLTTMCGFSIPKQILADILEVDSGQTIEDIKEVTVTQYETPIIL